MLKRISTAEAAPASAADNTRSSLGASAQPTSVRGPKYLPARFGLRTSARRADAAEAVQIEASGERCKYLQRRATLRLRSRGSGFSLIEVVIALAVFLFGALAIVRIFPGAIAVIQTSEQRNVAQRMNQTSLARYTNAPLSVPEAIADIDPTLANTTNPTGWSDFAGSVYGTATRNESLPRSAPAPDDISFDNSAAVTTQIANSAAGHFRRVLGEAHGAGNGVIKLRFPYLNINDPLKQHTVRAFRKIEVEGVRVEENGDLDFTDATVDGQPFHGTGAATEERKPADASLLFDSRGRKFTPFYVSYRWRQRKTDGVALGDLRYDRINGVVDEQKMFPDNNGAALWNATSGYVGRMRLPENTTSSDRDRVVPGRVRVWFASPVKTAEVIITDAAALVGFIEIKLGAPPAGVTSSDTLFFDYTVPDWRFLVADDNLTGISQSDQDYLSEHGYKDTTLLPRQIIAPTRFITDEQTSTQKAENGGAQLYTVLTGRTAAGTLIKPSITFWSPDKFPNANNSNESGQSEPDNLKHETTAPDFRALAVRPKTGQVFFNTQKGTDTLTAAMVRLVYRNLDGWLQQPSVAARTYLPYEARYTTAVRGEFPREPWREYVLNTADDALYFHPSEAGKTVLATYQYMVPGATVPVTMRDVPLTVRENLVEPPTDGSFDGFALNPNATPPAGTKVQGSRAYFVDNEGRCIGTTAQDDQDVVSTKNTPTDKAKIIAILSIKGASVRVRSAWYDGGRYSQNDVSGYRSLDVESNSRS